VHQEHRRAGRSNQQLLLRDGRHPRHGTGEGRAQRARAPHREPPDVRREPDPQHRAGSRADRRNAAATIGGPPTDSSSGCRKPALCRDAPPPHDSGPNLPRALSLVARPASLTSMRTTRLLRAYSLLGSGAALTTLISLVATKLYALTLGTEGFAQLTLLNAFLSIAVLFCATGVSTAFVREGVRSLTAAARIPYGTVRAAGHLLVFATSLALVIVTLGASDGVLDWFFDDSIGRSSLLLIAAAVFFQTAGGI